MSNSMRKSALIGAGIDPDASEEEISEAIHARLKELAFLACLIAMPCERRLRIKEALALFEGCAGLYRNYSVTKPILRAAANSR